VGEVTIMLTATNSGQVPVTLSGCKLFIRGQPEETSVAPIDWVAQAPSRLPIRLDPGGHWTGMIAADPVKQSLDRHFGPREHWEVRAALWDTAGRTYRPARSRKGWRRLWPSPWMKL
jgi:hypothetical protein